MLFPTLNHDTRNAVRDLLLTRLNEAGYTPRDVKRVTSRYDDSECKTIVRFEFKQRKATGDLILKLPGRVDVQSKILIAQ